MAEEQSNIKIESNSANVGLNMDNSLYQVQRGQLTYALNATLENYDSNSSNYQNEPGNVECLQFPDGYLSLGNHFIPEISKHIFFLVNPDTGGSEIGYMENNDCIYHTYINTSCLGFNINYPILKAVHKITNCSVEVYFTDALNPRRVLDLNNLPYKTIDSPSQCDPVVTSEIDCNKLNVQPDFTIPQLEVTSVTNGGSLTAGTVQFAIQYSDANGNGYTSYYSVTNPTPIANPRITTPDFNYNVGKSVNLLVSNIDTTGYFQYFNIAVIKTINNISSSELIGTYFIENSTREITYNGQNQTQIRLTLNDIFEKHPSYEVAKDVTTVQDIIVWDQLSSIDRINYQKIANKIELQWQSYRIPATEDYSDELNATNLRGYLRDEIYPFEITWLITGGKQTDSFHIPGRAITPLDVSYGEISPTSNDFIGQPDPSTGTSPYWKIYNTATVEGTSSEYLSDPSYKGPYQYGTFSYWESTDVYPCQESIWGELAGQPIRHHKFPDVGISPIFETSTPDKDADGKYTGLEMGKKAIYSLGVKIDPNRIKALIQQSDLTQAQKDAIIGFKITRGNRDVNKSIIGKGILRNVGKYTREETDYYFPNYPYNDLREDPFLLAQNNAFNAQCNSYTITVTADGSYDYTDCFTNTLKGEPILSGSTIEVCSITLPTVTGGGTVTVTLIGYDVYKLTSASFTRFSYVNPQGSVKYITVYSASPATIQVQTSSVPARVAFDVNYTVSKISTN